MAGLGIGLAISGIAGIISSLIGGNAANQASAAQIAAANKALDFEEQAYYDQQAQQAPWVQAGAAAVTKMSQLMGLAPPLDNADPTTVGYWDQRANHGSAGTTLIYPGSDVTPPPDPNQPTVTKGPGNNTGPGNVQLPGSGSGTGTGQQTSSPQSGGLRTLLPSQVMTQTPDGGYMVNGGGPTFPSQVEAYTYARQMGQA